MKNEECRRKKLKFAAPAATFLHSPILILESSLVGMIQLYRWTLSPAKTFLFGPLAQCRFTPACSEYAQEAIQTHGVVAGGWLAARRVCRCHPWGKCGHDPVPPEFPISNFKFQVSTRPAR